MSTTQSFVERIVHSLFGSSKKKEQLKKRSLSLESLENRELLSVTPLLYSFDHPSAHVGTSSAGSRNSAAQASDLAPPTGLTVSPCGVESCLIVTWNAVDGADSYLLQRSTDRLSWETATITEGTDIWDWHRQIGVDYHYRVASIDSNGIQSEFSDVVTGRRATPLEAPVLVSPQRGADWILLEWNSIDHAQSYELRISKDNGQTWQWVAMPQINTYLFADHVLPDSEYLFKIGVAEASPGYTSSLTGNICAVSSYESDSRRPSRPSGLDATGQSASEIRVTWNPVDVADSYRLEVADSVAGAWSVLYEGSATEYVDTALDPNVFRYYRVSASNQAGLSDVSYAVAGCTFDTFTDPQAPTGLKAELPYLSWQPVEGAVSYLAQRSANGVDWTTMETTSQTAIIDWETNIAGERYYRVASIDSAGNLSGFSNVVTSRRRMKADVPEVVSETRNENSILLQWNRIDNALTYRVEVSTDRENWDVASWGHPTNMFMFVISSNPDVEYFFRIRVWGTENGYDSSDFSDVYASAVPGASLEVPRTPDGLTATATGDATVDVLWASVSSADFYRLETSTAANGPWTTAYEGTDAAFSCTDLDSDTIYFYRISAVNEAGTSQASTVVSAKTHAKQQETVPVVRIDSVQNAFEGGQSGYFRLYRDDTTYELTVSYSLAGSATNGSDYAWLDGSVTFAAGQAYVDIPIAAIDDTLVEGTEQIVLTLADGGTVYALDSERKSAALSILDNDVAVENPPIVDSFGLVHDSGDDATDRVTVNPKVTGTVTGNRAVGTVTIEFDHDGDGIVDGRITLESGENSFVYDPRSDFRWENPVDRNIDVVLSYRLVHRDSFGNELSVGNWESFEYTVTPPPEFSGTVSELTFSLRENGDWTTPGCIEIHGYSEGTSHIEIVVDSTGERIVLSSGYGYFQACLAKGFPLGATTTIRVRGFVFDPAAQMELYGDWQTTTVTPLPPTIGSLALERDTGANPHDGISSNLTLVGHIDSHSYDNGVYRFQNNSHIDVEFRCGETVLGHAVTDKDGNFRFNVRELPLVDGYREGTVSARTVGRTDDGIVVFGNDVEQWIRYEPAPLPVVSNFHPVDRQAGIVEAGIQVPLDSDVRLEFSYNIGNGWSTPFLVTPVNPNEPVSGATSETRSGEFYLRCMEQLTNGQTIEVRVRAVMFDSIVGETVGGSWQTISFACDIPVDDPAAVQSASIKNWTGQSGHSTADPTITGVVSNDGSLEGLVVEVWANDKPVGSTITDSNGKFTVRPTGLNYGTTSLTVKVREWNTLTSTWQYGNSETITFVLLAPAVAAPSIQNISLSDVTSPTGNNVTSNARIEGRLAEDGGHLNRVLIEFDLDGDSVADAFVFTDGDGRFGYTPDLPPGSYSISARACRFDAVANDWVAGSWTTLAFTLTAPENDIFATVTEVGPAFVLATENGVASTNDPALAGRVSSPGGFGGVVVQIDLDADGTVDHQMGLNADGTFRWRPTLDENAETTVFGNVRAGKYDIASNEIIWGDRTAFSYRYVPKRAAPSLDEEPQTPAEAKLKLVYTKDSPSGNVTATGVRVVGGTPGRQVCFDCDGDGTVDFTLTADEQGFISFDRLDLSDPERFAEGLFIGTASIFGSDNSDAGKTIRFAVVNLHDDTAFDESELIEQQNEFYRGYVTLLEAYDEWDRLNANAPPVETPSDVGETMTDEQRHRAKLQSLARLGLTESDLTFLEGAAPALPSPSSDPLSDISNDISCQTEIWRINNDYRTAVADLTRNYAAQNLLREIRYDSQLDSAWVNYYHTISVLQKQQAGAGDGATADMQAAWAAQSVEANAVMEIAALNAMYDLTSQTLASQNDYQTALSSLWAQASTDIAAVLSAAASANGYSPPMQMTMFAMMSSTMNDSSGADAYAARFLANAVAEMTANIAAQIAYRTAVISAQFSAAQTSLQAWKTASEKIIEANKTAQKEKIDAWKTLRNGANDATKTYNEAIKSANDNYNSGSKSITDEYTSDRSGNLNEYRQTCDDAEITLAQKIAEAGHDYSKINDAYDEFSKATADAEVELQGKLIETGNKARKATIDLEKTTSDSTTKAEYEYEKRCIELLEAYWKAVLGVETGLQNTCLGASSGYASTLNGTESGLSSALLGASTAYATATTGAAQTRANADLDVENEMIGDEGERYYDDYFAGLAGLTGPVAAYYNTVGQIDRGLFVTSLDAATGLVSSLLAKSFGAEFASIGVSDGYGSAVNGAASGYANSMLDVSKTFAQAGIDVGESYAKGVIDAKITYMKAMNDAFKERANADAAAMKERHTQGLDLFRGIAEDYLSERKNHYGGVGYELDFDNWYHNTYDVGENCFHSWILHEDFGVSICDHHPQYAKIEATYTATRRLNSITYTKTTYGAEKTYAVAVAGLAKTAAQQAIQAETTAAQGEADAVDQYCNAVREAAETATDALIDIARNSDPTTEIVSYLVGMAEAEGAAEVAKIQALGVFQVAVRQGYLDTLTAGDSRYDAAAADLIWTRTAVESRNSYYAQLHAASVLYTTTTLGALQAYNSAQFETRATLQRQQMQYQFEYDNSRRGVVRTFVDRERQIRNDYETAVANASYDERTNLAVFKAELAGNLWVEYGSQFNAAQSSGADDGAIAGMLAALERSGGVAESQNWSASYVCINDQAGLRAALHAQAAEENSSANALNEAALETGLDSVDAQYLSQYHFFEAVAEVADAANRLACDVALAVAQQEFAEEQCRLNGLLQESLDTGVNLVDAGTSSLSFQVCFAAGESVRLSGGKTVRVENVKPGMRVCVPRENDPEGAHEEYEIVEVYRNDPAVVCRLTIRNEITGDEFVLRPTEGHRFYVVGKSWVQVRDLNPGDVFLNENKEKTLVLVSKEREATPVPVYNFQVRGAHTYFVGKTAQESVLAHNEGCGRCGGTGTETVSIVVDYGTIIYPNRVETLLSRPCIACAGTGNSNGSYLSLAATTPQVVRVVGSNDAHARGVEMCHACQDATRDIAINGTIDIATAGIGKGVGLSNLVKAKKGAPAIETAATLAARMARHTKDAATARKMHKDMVGKYASLKELFRIDAPQLSGGHEIHHVHIAGGGALNFDGTWKHNPPGGWQMPRLAREFLENHGIPVP